MLNGDRAEIEQILDHQRYAAGIALTDERATMGALLEREHPRRLECPQCLAQGAASYPKLFRELALRRKLIPGLQSTRSQHVSDLLADYVKCPRRRFRLERQSRQRTCGSAHFRH